jgi:alpha-glucosidase (family GH31 glycosyl hydrolase)
VWYDFWTEERIEGGRGIDRRVDLETIPLYIRAGSVIPFGPVKQYAAEPIDTPLEVRVYPGRSGTFVMYEDDAMSFAYKKGEWMGTQMDWDTARRRFTVSLARGSKMLPPLSRALEIRQVPDLEPKRLVFKGARVQLAL